MRFILLALFCLCLSGCLNANLDTKIDTKIKTEVDAKFDTEISGIKAEFKAEIKAEIKTEIKAEIKMEVTAEIKTDLNLSLSNKMDTKLNLLSGDITQKLQAEFQTQIDTRIQNTGMFSGGGVYVTVVAIVLIVAVFGTFLWLLKKIMQWKQIWHILSALIESNADDGMLAENVKRDFSTLISAAGLSHVIDSNLEKRGLKKKA